MEGKSTILLTVLIFTLLLAGCSALEMASRQTRKSVASTPNAIVNSVQASRGRVVSFGRVFGKDELEIDRTLEISTAALDHRGRVRFLVPADRPTADFDELQTFVADGIDDFSDALAKTLAAYLTFVEVDVEVDVVLASELGSYYSSSIPIKDRLLVSLLTYDPFSKGTINVRHPDEWWSAVILVTAHELAHLHYSLIETRPRVVNEEAAASLLGSCAHFRHGLTAESLVDKVRFFDKADDPQYRGSFPEQIGQLFPEIDLGRLNPDPQEFQKLVSQSQQGRALADAVLYLLAGSNEIHPAEDRDAFERIFDYCDGLADEVPRFHMGEW